MKRFLASQLERALDLHEYVESERWELATMTDDDKQLHCEFWVFKARALLADDTLPKPDQDACRWILGVARAIAAQTGIYVHGLSRNHHDNWSARAKAVGARLRARQKRRALDATRVPRSKVTDVRSSSPDPSPSFPRLAGATVVVIGGEPDNVLLARLRDADFTLDWTPANVRQVQAAVERIRKGKVGGVIFLADLNRHASFYLVRDACRLSGTPLTLGTKGLAAIRSALGKLDEQVAVSRKSA